MPTQITSGLVSRAQRDSKWTNQKQARPVRFITHNNNIRSAAAPCPGQRAGATAPLDNTLCQQAAIRDTTQDQMLFERTFFLCGKPADVAALLVAASQVQASALESPGRAESNTVIKLY
jgi:hypothetical protein